MSAISCATVIYFIFNILTPEHHTGGQTSDCIAQILCNSSHPISAHDAKTCEFVLVSSLFRYSVFPSTSCAKNFFSDLSQVETWCEAKMLWVNKCFAETVSSSLVVQHCTFFFLSSIAWKRTTRKIERWNYKRGGRRKMPYFASHFPKCWIYVSVSISHMLCSMPLFGICASNQCYFFSWLCTKFLIRIATRANHFERIVQSINWIEWRCERERTGGGDWLE